MDSYRKHPSEFSSAETEERAPARDVAAAIGTDERRMHVRAYNHWVGLLGGRDFPSIEDLEPGEVEDFASHSVLLDFTCSRDDPAIAYVGAGIREECALGDNVRTIADVPSRSLLSRLTDHYMQIIANRAPVGFEAEFDNPAGDTICYRGILMPFSSDGDTIDFIYGVINWKHVAANANLTLVASPVFDLDPPSVETGVEEEPDADATYPVNLSIELDDFAVVPEPVKTPDLADEESQSSPVSLEYALPGGDDSPVEQQSTLDAAAGLADRLWAARETAETVKAGEGRTRAALYQALSLAYDFALAAESNPDDYAELLEESGVKAQARAPMTPVVKLVFGVDYDKARLTEFAAALSFAHRSAIDQGGFQHFIERHSGGLKGLVAAERSARRPDGFVDERGAAALARLRAAPVLSLETLAIDEEFALVVTRRGPDGVHRPVAVVSDPALIDRAIRRAA